MLVLKCADAQMLCADAQMLVRLWALIHAALYGNHKGVLW